MTATMAAATKDNSRVWPASGAFCYENDIITLSKEGVDNDDIKVFISEMVEFFIDNWTDEYQQQLSDFKIKIDDKNLDDFNKLIGNYPCWGGYEILSETFTVPINLYKLSDKTRSLLGYFYSIHL